MSTINTENFLPELLPDGSVSIKNFCGYSLTEVRVPEAIDGKRVSKIGYGAFYKFDCLEQVVIDEGVELIEEKAFSECENLKSVSIPSSVKTIEKNAFFDCFDLREVRISSLADWLRIDFDNSESNPMHFCAKVYLGDELIT